MTRTAKYRVSIWSDCSSTEPLSQTVVIPEKWGSADAFIAEIETDLEKMQDSGDIERYEVAPMACEDMQPEELREWVAEFKEE